MFGNWTYIPLPIFFYQIRTKRLFIALSSLPPLFVGERVAAKLFL